MSNSTEMGGEDFGHSCNAEILIRTLNQMQSYQQILQQRFQGMQTLLIELLGKRGLNIVFAFRNKLGLTKEEAKKIYYQFHSKNASDQEPEGEPAEPQSNEEKISMIMDYMKETSQKLDKIEDDIEYLKQQVNQILQKL